MNRDKTAPPSLLIAFFIHTAGLYYNYMPNKTPKIAAANSLRRSQLYFYGLSMLTSLFNFLYYPVLARLVPVDVYGEVQFIATLLFQLSTLFLALNVVSIVITINYGSDDKLLSSKLQALSSLLNNLTLLLTFGLVAILWLVSERLQFSSPLPFIAMAIAVISTVPFTLGVGVFQGKDRYLSAGLLNLSGAVIKLIAAVLFVLAGAGATGAIFGIAVGQIVALIIFSLQNNGLRLRSLVSMNLHTIRSLVNDRLLIISSVCVLIINGFMGLDMVLSKFFLSSNDAGEYAGVATLAKIAIFVVSPLMWIAISYATKSSGQSTVKKLVALAGFFSASLSILYLVAGDTIISITVGNQYLAESHLLTLASVAAGLMAIAAMLNIILVARSHFVHVAVQTGLMIVCWGVVITVCLFSSFSLIVSILVAQAVSGSLGIAYYSIIGANVSNKNLSKDTADN